MATTRSYDSFLSGHLGHKVITIDTVASTAIEKYEVLGVETTGYQYKPAEKTSSDGSQTGRCIALEAVASTVTTSSKIQALFFGMCRGDEVVYNTAADKNALIVELRAAGIFPEDAR